MARAAAVHLNLRAGSTFPVPVCTVSPILWVKKADNQSRTRSDFMLHIGGIYFYQRGGDA